MTLIRPTVHRIALHSFLGLLDRESIVVDLGMNNAAFTREIVQLFECRVFGVEPVPALFAALPDLRRVVKEQVAISGTPGRVTLHLNATQCASTRFKSSGTSLQVDSTTLAAFLDFHTIGVVDLVKMDIEGAELDVLLGIDDSHMLRVRQLTVEFHDFVDPRLRPRVRAVDHRLRALGFRRIKFTVFTNGDVLYIHPDVPLGAFTRLSVTMRGKYIRGLIGRLPRHRQAPSLTTE